MRKGEVAPDVTLPDQTGAVRPLSTIADGSRTVLFFYPAAMTTGCTREGQHFRDLAAAFAEVNAVRVGISMDPVEKQARFAEANAFEFPLLSDVDGTVARTFGVKRRLDALRTRRVTFVLDEDRRVLDVIRSELSMAAHADRALRILAATPSRDRG